MPVLVQRVRCLSSVTGFLVFFCENKPYITDAFSYAKQLGVQLQKIDDGPFKKAYDKYAPWLHNIRRTQYNNSEGGC